MNIQITARVERRTWWVDGQYAGDRSPFVPDTGETARDLTGDRYGEWQGTRHFDGEAILQADIRRAIEARGLLLRNHPDSPLGDASGHPWPILDCGEYRVITTAVVAGDE